MLQLALNPAKMTSPYFDKHCLKALVKLIQVCCSADLVSPVFLVQQHSSPRYHRPRKRIDDLCHVLVKGNKKVANINKLSFCSLYTRHSTHNLSPAPGLICTTSPINQPASNLLRKVQPMSPIFLVDMAAWFRLSAISYYFLCRSLRQLCYFSDWHCFGRFRVIKCVLIASRLDILGKYGTIPRRDDRRCE